MAGRPDVGLPPFGRFEEWASADKEDHWAWEGGTLVSYRGEIVDLMSTEVLNVDTSTFETGAYTFTFGFDDNPDGNLDRNRFYSQTVTVNIVQ
ncbi:MAG: hypothetical protein L3V56_14865 [Candidatus Magnetoovum sp. WYHC-5]|nr:hypothetical protein [Candidatus Magnetoovum sp. WYHC-5]